MIILIFFWGKVQVNGVGGEQTGVTGISFVCRHPDAYKPNSSRLLPVASTEALHSMNYLPLRVRGYLGYACRPWSKVYRATMRNGQDIRYGQQHSHFTTQHVS